MVSDPTQRLPTYSPRKASSYVYMQHKNIKLPPSWHAHPNPATCGARTQLTASTAEPYTLTLPTLPTMANTSMTCGPHKATTANSSGTLPRVESKSMHYVTFSSTKNSAQTMGPPSGTRHTMDSPPGTKPIKSKATIVGPRYHGTPRAAPTPAPNNQDYLLPLKRPHLTPLTHRAHRQSSTYVSPLHPGKQP